MVLWTLVASICDPNNSQYISLCHRKEKYGNSKSRERANALLQLNHIMSAIFTSSLKDCLLAMSYYSYMYLQILQLSASLES